MREKAEAEGRAVWKRSARSKSHQREERAARKPAVSGGKWRRPKRRSRGSSTGEDQKTEEEGEDEEEEPVLVHIREKLVAMVGRGGDIKHAQIFGSVATAEFNTVALQMSNNSDAAEGMRVNLEIHPKMDKAAWAGSSILRLKNANKPVQKDVGVLKWEATIQDEEALPITLNVLPKEAPDGYRVFIEYTLQRTGMTLNDVVIIVPLPTSTTPVVVECEGRYKYQQSRNQLVWTVPVIDASNDSGTMEFLIPNGTPDHFFPISIRFSSTDTPYRYCGGRSAVERWQRGRLVLDREGAHRPHLHDHLS